MTEGMPPAQMTDAEIAEELAHNARQFRAGHVEPATGLPVHAFGDAHADARHQELAKERDRRRSSNPPTTETKP